MKNVFNYTKKYLPYLIATPLVLILEVILEVNIPTVMADIVDIAIPSGELKIVLKYGLKMILMAICSLLAGCAGSYLSCTGSIGFGSQLRRSIFDKIQEFSFEDIDNFQSSSLLTRLTTDIDYVQQGLRMCLTMFIRAPFMMVAASVVAYKLNSRLFVIFLVAAPILVTVIVLLAFKALPMFRYMLTRYDALNDNAKEYLTNVRTVKAYVREDHEIDKFQATNKELMETSIKSESLLALLSPIVMLVIYSCMIAIYYYGGKQVMIGTMQIGELTAFTTYVAQILTGLIMMAMIFMNIVRLKTSFDRLSEVLNHKINLVDGDFDGTLVDGSIKFNKVSFCYNKAQKDAIKNVTFKIESGETIGIIGATGSGKTSLVQLIPRLYDVTKGQVIVGKHNVKDYKIKTLRDNVAMVLQQNILFSGTIEDNLRWGNENATHQEIVDVCQKAQIEDFINDLPKRYSTVLGQGGVNVSGGQKQRLCIARALLKKPKIIILDDSTSAVDTHTDSEIRKALKEELAETTTIIIAQRIASVMDADRVMVINNGKIDAFDTPSNLLKTNEIYRDIYETQMKGVEA